MVTSTNPPTTPPGICCLIITYEPEKRLLDNLAVIMPQVSAVYIVDNGSKGNVSRDTIRQSVKWPSVHLIQNRENLGIGHALNQGFREAEKDGFKLVLALDQDSLPTESLVDDLLKALRDQPMPEKIAVVSPQLTFFGLNVGAKYLRQLWGPFFALSRCHGDHLFGVTATITSGSVFSLKAYRSIGDFREDFFVDYIDTEYCLRAQREGFDIVVACNAILEHQWGNRAEIDIGPIHVRPTHHPPARWYYISRNRVPMLREYWRQFPHWLVFDLVVGAWWIVRMLLFETKRSLKVRSLISGTYDGLIGRMGRRSDKTK